MNKQNKIVMIVGLAIAGVALILLTVSLFVILGRDNETTIIIDKNNKNSSDNSNSTTVETNGSTQMLKRNEARKRAVSLLVAGITNYMANNGVAPEKSQPYYNGQPDESTSLGPYIDQLDEVIKSVVVFKPSSPVEDFADFSRYGITGAFNMPTLDTITVLTGQRCRGDIGTESSSSTWSAAIVVQVEVESGEEKFYCQDVS